MKCVTILSSLLNTFGSQPDENPLVDDSLKDARTKTGKIPTIYILTYTGPPDTHDLKYASVTDRTSSKVGIHPGWLANIENEDQKSNRSDSMPPWEPGLFYEGMGDGSKIRSICDKGFTFHQLFEYELRREIEKRQLESGRNAFTESRLIRDELDAISRVKSTILDEEEYGMATDMAHVPLKDYRTFTKANGSLVDPASKLSPKDLRWSESIASGTIRTQKLKHAEERLVEGQSQDNV